MMSVQGAFMMHTRRLALAFGLGMGLALLFGSVQFNSTAAHGQPRVRVAGQSVSLGAQPVSAVFPPPGPGVPQVCRENGNVVNTLSFATTGACVSTIDTWQHDNPSHITGFCKVDITDKTIPPQDMGLCMSNLRGP